MPFSNRLLKKVADLPRCDSLNGDGCNNARRRREEWQAFAYIDLEARVRANHPPRPIRESANAALAAVSGDFAALYSELGRSSIAPRN